jgi:uncharacterized protein
MGVNPQQIIPQQKEVKIMESTEISRVLYEQSQEYRTLFDQHRTLENRLSELSSRLYLSDSEKVEEVDLKKKKLVLKDRMQQIVKNHS